MSFMDYIVYFLALFIDSINMLLDDMDPYVFGSPANRVCLLLNYQEYRLCAGAYNFLAVVIYTCVRRNLLGRKWKPIRAMIHRTLSILMDASNSLQGDISELGGKLY